MRASYLALAAAIGLAATPALAERQGFLETVHKHQTLALTTPDNGDLNPYAVVVAPTSAGKVAEGDVLAAARAVAQEILACSPLAVRATKEAALRSLHLPAEEAIAALKKGK